MILVVDASAIAAVIYGEPEGSTIRAHVRGSTMIAPHLIDYELANVGLKKIRRAPEVAAQVLAMLDGLDVLAIRRLPAKTTEVAALAVKAGISAYDASYLWLAMTNDCELVTLDARLARVNAQLRELPG
jgi:predicted nucleic acid-binding protein